MVGNGFFLAGKAAGSAKKPRGSGKTRGQGLPTTHDRIGRKAEGGRGANARMDMTWVTDRIAVGGGIWTDDKMIEVVRAGVTHIIDMQIEWDDTKLAAPYGVKVLWNPTDDDFRMKPAELLQRGVDFALEAFEDAAAKVFIHCAAGVHRAPMMTLAVLRATGWTLDDAIGLVEGRRPVADFAQVYVDSVEEFMKSYEAAGKASD